MPRLKTDNPPSSSSPDIGTLHKSYVIPVLLSAIEIMDALRESSYGYTHEELCRQVALPKSTVFRLLQTLTHRGYAIRTAEKRYYYAGIQRRKLRFGVICGEIGDQTAQDFR